METKIDNSPVAVSWQQIINKINQLNQLKDSPAAMSDIIAVVNSLHNMLLSYSVENNNKIDDIVAGKRVAVVMPSIFTEDMITTVKNREHEVMMEEVAEMGAAKDYGVQPDYEEENTTFADAVIEDTPARDAVLNINEPEATPTPDAEEKAADSNIPVSTGYTEIAPAENTIAEKGATSEDIEVKPSAHYSVWEAYSSNEIPTLAQQNRNKISNTVSETVMVNDDVNNTLPIGEPVKDLKKAISIGDRYLYINELFRGEESSYERSIKTINNFNVYQEARYWIDRELKVKLGWSDKNPVVRQFDSIVQRRFA